MSTHADIRHQYLNVRVANDSIVPFSPAQYTRNNTSVLLEQPRLYKLSVDRFKIPSNTIPLVIAQSTGVTNELIYEFSMSADGVNFTTANVTFYGNGLSTTDPRYYYVYSYSRFIYMLNQTLKTLFDTLFDATFPVPLPADPNYKVVPPHFEFDSVSQKLSLVVPEELFDTELPGATWKIRFNFDLLRFFAGFESNIIVNGQLYEFRTYNRYNNVVPVVITDFDVPPNEITENYLNMIADFNALSRWNELDSIQIITNLPVNHQFVETSDPNASTSSKPILTDFIVFYPDPNSYAATTIDYSTTERSWFDLYGTSPIRNVQLTFLWVSFTGNTYPLYLSKGDAIPLKLLFKVRDDI